MMNIKNQFIHSLPPIRAVLIVLSMSLVLNGCDNNDKKPLLIQQPVQIYAEDTTLKGKVTHKNKSIGSGEIKAIDSVDKVVATTQLEKGSRYSITIPEKTQLPIELIFYPDKDNSDIKQLVSAVIYTSIKKYDINDLTTLIAKNAKALGGYNHSNMTIAADSTVGIPDANKTSTGFRGDPTKQYGGWH